MVAKALVVLDRPVDPRQQGGVVIHWSVDVQAAAVAVPAAGADLELAEGLGLGLLTNDIDHAAGVATAIQAGSRAFEYFDALNAGGVRRTVAATVDGEAVLVQLAGGEAAHAVIEEGQAAEVVLPGHAAGKVQGAVYARSTQVIEHLCGYHIDALGNLGNRRIGTRRAGRTGGAVTLNWAICLFLAGGDGGGRKLNGVFCCCSKGAGKQQAGE